MNAILALPNLGNWLVTKEFTGPDAAVRASLGTSHRNGDGFTFLGQAVPYLRFETAEFGLYAIRVGKVTSSGHHYRFANAYEDWVVMTWPIVGTLSVATDLGSVRAQPGQCVFIPPGHRGVTVLPGAGHFTADRLMVSWAALAPALARMGVSTQALQQCVQASAASPAGSRLYQAIAQLLASSTAPVTLGLGGDAKRRAIEEFVIDLAAAALVEAGAFRADELRPTTTLQVVRAAEDLIRRNIASEVSIENLGELLDVGDRSLQIAFKKVRGYSARTYLLNVRLEAARQRIMSSDVDNAVTEAALAAGFSHLSRFSAYYRQRYGESPSQSLRRRNLGVA